MITSDPSPQSKGQSLKCEGFEYSNRLMFVQGIDADDYAKFLFESEDARGEKMTSDAIIARYVGYIKGIGDVEGSSETYSSDETLSRAKLAFSEPGD